MISKKYCNVLFYCLLLLVVAGRSYGSDKMKDLFKQGNDSYAKSQYKEAVLAYQKIANAGYKSPILFFNLANAQYKAGAISSSVLYYERALKLAPNDKDILFNLQLAKAKTSDKLDETPSFFLEDWWRSIVLIASADTFAILNLIFLFLGVGLLILYLYASSIRLKKRAFFSGLVFIFLSLTAGFLANRQWAYIDSKASAILFSSVVQVKSSPNAQSKTLFVLHEGSKVGIVQSDGRWAEIQLPNGNKGWIESINMQSI